MGLLQLPKKFHLEFSNPRVAPNGSVELDYTNSLVPDAQCVVPSTGLMDLVTKEVADFSLATVHKREGFNRGMSFHRFDRNPDTAFISYANAPILETSTGCTIHLGYYMDSDNAFSQNMIASRASNTFLGVRNSGGTNVTLRHNNGFTGNYSAGTTPSRFEWHDYTIVAKGTDRDLYIDGKFVESITSGGTNFQFDQILRRADGYLNYFYTYNRALESVEIASLSRDPYQVLRPTQDPVYFVPDAAPGGVTVNIPTGAINLTGQTPIVVAEANITVTVPAGSISLTGLAPTVQAGDDVDIDVPVGSIALTGLVPVVQVTDNIDVNVPVGSITLTGQVPIVQVGDNVTLEIPVGAISLAGFAPTLDLTNNITVDIPTGSISLNGFAPFVDLGDTTVAVNSGTITLQGFAPIVIVGGAVWTVQPDQETVWTDQIDTSTTWTIQ